MNVAEKLRVIGRALRGSSHDRYLIAERTAVAIHPEAVLPEVGRVWLADAEFRALYERFQGARYPRRMERVWLVDQLARLAATRDGDTVECGVHLGLSSYVMCRRTKGTGKVHHAFDSFEGLSSPSARDGAHWQPGDLAVSVEDARRHLAEFDFVRFHVGWLPGTLDELDPDARYAMVHLDLDLHEPTLACLEHFLPRMAPGGVIVVDDYGLDVCPGVRAAVDAAAAHRPEVVIDLPTSQALLISENR